MTFVKALVKTELPPGQAKCVILEGKKIALFNVDGVYYAIDDTCSHEEASLSEGTIRKGERCACAIECPWHGAQFDLSTGAVLTLPAIKPVKSYRVRVEGEAVEVEI